MEKTTIEAPYGYILKSIEGDKYKLKDTFNYYMKRIYNNLTIYYNQETVNKVYPKIYKDMCECLQENIGLRYGDIMLAAKTITALTILPDPFSESCVLSTGNFNDIQKSMIRSSIKYMISGTNGFEEVYEKNRKKLIDRIYGISRVQYYMELIKANKEVKKVLKETQKTGLVLVK